MILVDTSVWIALFRGGRNQAVLMFERILERDLPFVITGIVYQEVLQGARASRDHERLRRYLGSQRFIEPRDSRSTFEGAAGLYRRCRRQGVTVRSTVDCLIAQLALERELPLLHHDADFDHMAHVIPELDAHGGPAAP